MCRVTFTLILFVVKVTIADILPQNYTDAYSEEVLDFALAAYLNLCKECRLTTLIGDKYDLLPNLFLRNLNLNDLQMPFVTISTNTSKTHRFTSDGENKSDLYLIFINENLHNIAEIIHSSKRLWNWNRSAKIVLIVHKAPSNDIIAWIYETFQTLWNRRILHVCVCFWLDDKLRIHALNPFSDEHATDATGKNYSYLNKLLEHNHFDLHGFPISTFVYDLYAYKRRISYRQMNDDYVGLDGKFLTIIRDKLNATLDIRKESVKRILEIFFIKCNNKTSVVPGLFIIEYDIDFWSTVLRCKVNANVDYLYLHERDDICVVVPRAGQVPQYLHIFLIVPIGMWIGTFVSMLVVAVTLHLMHRRAALLDVWRVLLSPPVSDSSRMSERYVLASWIMFSLIFAVVFQCTLTSTLVVPKYYKNIETMKELAKTNLTIYSSYFDLELLKQNMDVKTEGLLDKFVGTPLWSVEETLDHERHYNGFLMRGELAREFIKLTTDRGSRTSRYHIIRERPVPSAQGFPMAKDYPFYKQSLWIVNRVHESGLYFQWQKNNFGWDANVLNVSQNVTGHNIRSSNENKFVPLSLEHLQSAFYLLALGLSVSVIFFIIERFK